MMEQVLAVQRMQDYIEENLYKKIALSDLAQVSHFSPWYSYRLFRDHLGVTPAEYICKLRLSRAALCLRDENCRITDVAFALGFGSVDEFTRAFFRAFGCNPGDYAKTPVPISLFIPYDIKYRTLRKENIDMKNYRVSLSRLCINRSDCVS